jgi:hypothetical protein
MLSLYAYNIGEHKPVDAARWRGIKQVTTVTAPNAKMLMSVQYLPTKKLSLSVSESPGGCFKTIYKSLGGPEWTCQENWL